MLRKGLVPPADDLIVTGGAMYQGSLYLVWVSWLSNGSDQVWLERVEPHKVWRLTQVTAWDNVRLVRIGDALVVAAPVSRGPNAGMTMARLDLSRDTGPDTDVRVLVPGDDEGWILETAETPGHGFAAVWGGNGGPIDLIHVDCCPVR